MTSNIPKPKLAKGAAKDHILKVASKLFYEHGIRAVGVDTIVAQSGVVKATLYDHFPSKDDLINAYLMMHDQAFWHVWDAALLKSPDSPVQQLRDLFDVLDAGIANSEVFGCAFLSAASEFPELTQASHQLALVHKQKVKMQFQSLAQAANVVHPEELAEQLLLVLNGAFASKRIYGAYEGPVRQLATTANMLLDAHLTRAG
ncbi:MAG: TetR/AcrR family transcriptional regulator [Chloroflexia bacterium]|nr:TetR/AcrR family transcriptional regulator [Chloroflexia bacterium]